MNAYPISKRIKSPRENDIDLLQAIGEPILPEIELKVFRDLKLQGMGYTKRDERSE